MRSRVSSKAAGFPKRRAFEQTDCTREIDQPALRSQIKHCQNTGNAKILPSRRAGALPIVNKQQIGAQRYPQRNCRGFPRLSPANGSVVRASKTSSHPGGAAIHF